MMSSDSIGSLKGMKQIHVLDVCLFIQVYIPHRSHRSHRCIYPIGVYGANEQIMHNSLYLVSWFITNKRNAYGNNIHCIIMVQKQSIKWSNG